jgi:hypothetical protein
METDADQQLDLVEGFGDVVVGPEADTVDPVLRGIAGGEDDHRDGVQGLVVLDNFTEFEAASSAASSGRAGSGPGSPGASVPALPVRRRPSGPVSLHLQPSLQDLQVDRFVIDHQDQLARPGRRLV